MKSEIPFTPDQLKGMADSYVAGATIDSLAAEFGVSAFVIRDRLTAQGIKFRRRGPSGFVGLLRDKKYQEKIKALRLSGLTVNQVCKKLHIGHTTYYRSLRA